MTVFRTSTAPFWLLAAAALLLRVFLPAGWMPQVSPDGVRIALCTSGGTVMATMDTDGTIHRDAPNGAPARDTCPYGVGLAALDVPQAPAIDSPGPALQPLPPAARATIGGIVRRSLRPPARGPPRLA